MSFLCLRLKMQMDMDHECGNLPLGIAEITRFETACVKMYVYSLTRRLKISAENTEDALKWPQHPTELKEKRRYNELSSFEKVQRVVRYLGIYQGIKLISRATFNSLLMSLQPGYKYKERIFFHFFLFVIQWTVLGLVTQKSNILHIMHYSLTWLLPGGSN